MKQVKHWGRVIVLAPDTVAPFITSGGWPSPSRVAWRPAEYVFWQPDLIQFCLLVSVKPKKLYSRPTWVAVGVGVSTCVATCVWMQTHTDPLLLWHVNLWECLCDYTIDIYKDGRRVFTSSHCIKMKPIYPGIRVLPSCAGGANWSLHSSDQAGELQYRVSM